MIELTRIHSPTVPPDHPDRPIAGEAAIEPAFQALADAAGAAGWSRDETAFALLNLAVAHIKAIEANLDTDQAIARAVRAVGDPETKKEPAGG